MLKQQTTFNRATDVSLEDLESADAKSWIQSRVENECRRIRESNARAIPLPVRNCGVLVEHDDIGPTALSRSQRKRARRVKVVNRIEIASGMDFHAVEQIMVSEPTEYPFREGYSYVHVLAFTASSNSMALLMPYIYAPFLKKGPLTTDMIDRAAQGEQQLDEEVIAAKKNDKDSFENTLKEWVLINEKYSRARHSIKEFHSIA